MAQVKSKRDTCLQSLQRRKMVTAGAVLTGTAALGFGPTGWGQATPDWPTRPVRVIVPFSPGGSTDMLARVVAQALSRQLEQTFIVESKPGAGTTIGTAELVRSPPDGHTLLATTVTFVMSQYMYEKLSYDGRKDLIPLGLLMTTPLILVVNASSKFRTPADFLQFAKANPGKLTGSSSGIGGGNHLALELLCQLAGVDLLHVPYKGGSEAAGAVLSGATDFYFAAPLEVASLVQSGKLVVLAATSPKRTSGFAEVPTLVEAGVAGYEVLHYTVMMMRAGTPEPVVAKASEHLQRALQSPDMRKVVVQNGDATKGTREEAEKQIAADHVLWSRAVKNMRK